jgi:putative phosphoribosyl transferase
MNHLIHVDSLPVEIHAGSERLEGVLETPVEAKGLVLFAHGSGSSRHSPRNQQVAEVLQRRQLATLRFDLLSLAEEAIDRRTGHLRFDIALLADRLVEATWWAAQQESVRSLPIGYFGASTGAAAALVAAARIPERVAAIVSRGGRPDLAGHALPGVACPTLFIVGGMDHVVIDLNRTAFEHLTCEKDFLIVPGAGHLFEEPGALEMVADAATTWFTSHFVF